MIWLLSTEELRVLHGRLVFIQSTFGKLSPRAAAAAADIAAELWLRTGTPPDGLPVHDEKREVEAGR